MKKYEKIYLYMSISILVLVTLVSGFVSEKSLFRNISTIIAILIPALYSFIPLVDEYKIRKNRNKNRLSENTFTDREVDVKNILKKLLISEHIIEKIKDVLDLQEKELDHLQPTIEEVKKYIEERLEF